MTEHTHQHGTGEGQHVHEGWTPDVVIERMQKDGFCGQRVGDGVCMRRDDHDHLADGICLCGNRFNGDDNLCMLSACQDEE